MEQELTLVQRVLVRATELIKVKENWIKRKAFERVGDDPFAKYCSLGALNKATYDTLHMSMKPGGRSPRENECVSELYDKSVIAFERHVGLTCTSTWNDSPERKHEEVVHAFCTAVKKELGDGTDTSTDSNT